MASYLSQSQLELITGVLNRLIPPVGNMPSAGGIAVEFLDEAIGNSVKLRQLFGRELSVIELEANGKFSHSFLELADDQKDEVLRQVEKKVPEFFKELLQQTYNGYYTNSRVIQLLGLEARPPQPRGYQLEQGDFSVIEKVMKRGTVYREA